MRTVTVDPRMFQMVITFLTVAPIPVDEYTSKIVCNEEDGGKHAKRYITPCEYFHSMNGPFVTAPWDLPSRSVKANSTLHGSFSSALDQLPEKHL